MQTTLTLTASLATIARIADLLDANGYGDSVATSAGLPAMAELIKTGDIVTFAPEIDPSGSGQTYMVVDAADFDSSGLPWDERIHASTRTKKADLTWTRKRGTPDDVYQAVEAELRARFPNEAVATTVEPVAVAPVPVVMESGVVAVEPVTNEVHPMMVAMSPVVMTTAPVAVEPVPMNVPTTPVAVAPTPVVVAGPPSNLNELLAQLGPLLDPARGGLVTPEYLTGVINETNQAWAQHLGGKMLNSLGDIAAHPNLTLSTYVWQILQRDGKVA